MKNFVIYGILSILIYSISFYGNIFGEPNTIDYQFLYKFGGKGSEDGQLISPHSIDIDKDGYVYVTDTGNDRIQKYSPNGKFIQSYGTKGSTEGKFLEPHGIVFDSNNTMYVTDMKNSRVQVFDKDFNFIRQWGSFGTGPGQFSGTIPGIDYYEKEDLVFVDDKRSTNFQVFDENGKSISKYGSKGKQDGQFNRPEDIAIDPEGKVFVADTGNSRIQVFGTK
jgi:DNA-binding beta-propeller fold protein YncE